MGAANLSQHGDAMRCTLVFLTLLTAWSTFAGAGAVLAGEVILGRVLSIDGERTGLVVVPVSNPPQGEVTPDAPAIHVISPSDGLPPRLKTGDVVRIWGEYSTPVLFNASHLGYGRGRADPTGVRSRIGRSRGMGRGNGKGGRR